MKQKSFLIILGIIFWLNAIAQPLKKWDYPSIHEGFQADTLWGKIIKDPYHELENSESIVTKKWLEAEQQLTKEYFKNTNLDYWLENEIKSNDYVKYWWISSEGSKVAAYLEKPGMLGKYKDVEINQVAFLEDSIVAIFSFSKDGSDWNEIGVIDAKDYVLKDDRISQVKFSSIVPYKKGFFYCRFDSVDKKHFHTAKATSEKVYYHKIGTSATSDTIVFQRPSSFYNTYNVSVIKNGQYLLVEEENSLEGKRSVFVKELKQNSTFFPLINKDSRNISYIGYQDSFVYFITSSEQESNGSIVEINMNNPLKWEKVIPEQSNAAIRNAHYLDGRITILYQTDTNQLIKVVDIENDKTYGISLPKNLYYGMYNEANFYGGYLFVANSFTLPPIPFKYNSLTNKLVRQDAKAYANHNDEEYTCEYKMYPSKDGTMIPIHIVHKKNISLSSKAPLLVETYGGFGLFNSHSVDRGRATFMDRGGVYAYVTVRGEGYIQKGWHERGKLFNKQNSFDDFYYATKFLVQNGYGDSTRIAITGASSGGKLVMVCANQHPEWYKVVWAEVGAYDMLHFDEYTGGAHWTSEYGNPKEQKEFEYLQTYSPLHNVRGGVRYPSILLTTSDNDDRVPPLHTYKMLATLQKNAKQENPILMIVNKNAGHNGANTFRDYLKYERDAYTFIFKELGIKY